MASIKMNTPTNESSTVVTLLTELDMVDKWKRQQTLGSGTFATITLWVNTETNERIAIKQFKNNQVGYLPRQIDYYIEQWKQEIQLVQKMKCDSIVKALELPAPFKSLQISAPVLALEFCSGGDLRKLLNKSCNCCGLEEKEVRQILKQIARGIEYLHSLKIIHRDLKPENIVLQPLPNKKTLYKLTDLGYAKQLSDSSMANSFVGTLEYLAPELFSKKKYTSAVDNWSFGLIVYEIITGRRPFLPNNSIGEILKYIEMKKSSNICIELGEDNRSINFLDEISRFNHIGSTLKKDVETWLKTALEYDPSKRGGDSIFKQIIDLVDKYTVQVFNIETYETFSYEISEDTSLNELRKMIATNTNMKAENEHIVLPNGEMARKDIGSQIISAWYKPLARFERNNPIGLCVFDMSRELNYTEFYKNLTLPGRVERMLLQPSLSMEADEQRHTWRNSVWVAQQTLSKYYLLRSALRGCFMNCIHLYNNLQRENQHVGLWVRSLLTSTSLLRKYVLFHTNIVRDRLAKEKSCTNHDHSVCEQFDKRLELVNQISATFAQFDKFQHENVYKLFEKSSKIVPKFNKDNAIIQQLLKSCEIDESLREKYNDILAAYDSLRKRKKDDHSGAGASNNLMINLLCDCFKIIEDLIKQMFDILLVAVGFMKNTNLLTERSQAMQTIVGNWQKRIDEQHNEAWQVFSKPLTNEMGDALENDMPFMSRLNITNNHHNPCVLQRLEQLDNIDTELTKYNEETIHSLVKFVFNPLELYNLFL